MDRDARIGRPAGPSYNPALESNRRARCADRSHLPLRPARADDVEVEFYEALQRGDIERLMGLWSDDDEISCVHPGGPRLVGAVAIRASFEAMFANGARSTRGRRRCAGSTPTRPRCTACSSGSASFGPDGETFAWVVATNVYVKATRGWRLVAHHASPGTASEVPEIAETASDPALSRPARHLTDAFAMHDFRAPPWLPGGHAQTIWPVLFSRRFAGERPAFERERWSTPDGDFVDVDWLGRDAGRAPAGAVPRPRRLVGEPLRRGLRRRCARPRLALRGAALSRLLGRAQPGAARLPLGRLGGGRLAARPLSRAAPRDRSSRSASRSAATRCCASPRRPATQRARAGAGDRRDLGAARPRRRRHRDRPRLRPAGLHPHVPALDEAEGARASSPSTRACSTPSGCGGRATCATSTTSSPRRCTAFATPPTTTRAARPSRGWRRSAFRRWCSTRATIRSCRARRCRGRTQVGRHVTLWQPRARRPRRLRRRSAGRAISAPCPSRW